MSVARIYQPYPINIHTSFTLDEPASHHLARVLRVNKGDVLTLFNGRGGEYEAVITHIDKKSVHVNILSYSQREAESPLQIHLAQGIARGEKMDFIIQKAVELGIHQITPLMTERCNVKWQNEREEKKLKHWQAIAISACEQTGRNRIPIITPPQSFAQWLAQMDTGVRLVLTPHIEAKLPSEISKESSVVILIGPEGGLSDQEVTASIQQGFLPLNLGQRILRTETASLASIAILQYVYGDLA